MHSNTIYYVCFVLCVTLCLSFFFVLFVFLIRKKATQKRDKKTNTLSGDMIKKI
ncbi:hypothetical protein CROQUDRAFT_735773 [Cronartium quercuum f. sp. fusiforme G11]|uniref:Uncharacterized protein n=1 Tax=Cronartium quercuum f. sp. fusiforme G11 TaxID=708437 RepID=A0A9P6TEC9_9BASI|nr:hypothetical protein CROQUDRAFT_735773 [Cronartium quercuum f. sp. fusiforme G11]